MKYTIIPYVGAIPLKFGMTQQEISVFIPEILTVDIPTYGESQALVSEYIKISFDNGLVTEIEFYTGYNNSQTGKLQEVTPDLEFDFEFENIDKAILNKDQVLDELNKSFRPKYLPTIWIYPEIGISFCGYDGSLDYRSFCMFARKMLEFHLEDTEDPPKTTHLRPQD